MYYFFFRLGIAVEDEGPSIQKQSTGGYSNLINALNKRLITIFDQLARKPEPKEAILAMQEILKTPSKALKQLILLKMIELSQAGTQQPIIYFKFLSLWQKELKSNRTSDLNQDEKKFHFDTQRLIKNVLPAVLNYLESKNVTHNERMRLVPLLTKFCR